MDCFHHPPPYLEARSICRKEFGRSRFSGTKLISQKGTKMTHIPAKVLNVHKLYNEYLVTVVGHIERQKPQSERFGLSEFPNYALRMAADHGEFTFRSPDQPM